jgi:PKD repeat protein
VIDGNSNGLIEIADITPIGQNFQVRVTAYNIYASSALSDYPTSASAINGSAVLLGTVPFPEGPAPAGQRRMVSFEVTDPQLETYFWVRPTDGSSEGTPSNYFLLGAGENQPPVAQLTADPLLGDIPMLVEFDASASYDPDGEIVKYEWDWDGANNGWEWEDTGTTSIAEHTFENIAIFPATVRVTDDAGEMRTAAVEIIATAPGNEAPVAVLTADPPGGDPPLDVTLSAAGSYDLDGEILDYQWDFNDNDVYSEDGAETEARGAIAASVTLTEIGSHTVNLKVVDNDGAQAVASIDIDVGNFPPVAELSADPYVGDAPLTVSLSAAGSSDSDGSIANYEWDLDCNGVFGNSAEEAAAEGSAEAACTFAACGTYQPAVLVTDNEGATAIESISIAVTGPGWEIVTVHSERCVDPRLVVVNSHPAIAYTCGATLHYVRAATPQGASPLDWESKATLGVGGLPVLGVIEDHPAIAFCSSPGTVTYARATTTTGSASADWDQRAVVCVETEMGASPNGKMLVADGNPAIVIHCRGAQIWYARADTSTGSGVDDWGELVPVETEDCSHCPSAALVEGHPAIAYQDFSNSRLRYVRSTTSDGLTAGDWSEKVTVFDVFDLYEIPEAPCLSVINGQPAITWRHHFPDYMIGDLIYQRSYTAFGNHEEDWAADIIVFSSETLCFPSQLLEINGFPAISFIDA